MWFRQPRVLPHTCSQGRQRPSQHYTVNYIYFSNNDPLNKGHLLIKDTCPDYRRHFVLRTEYTPTPKVSLAQTFYRRQHFRRAPSLFRRYKQFRALFSASSSSSSPFSDIGGVHIVSSASTWPHTSTQSYTSPASPSSHICSLLPPSGDTTMHNFSFTIQLQYTFGEQTHVQNFKQFNKFYRPHYNTHSDAENRNLCLLIIIHVLIGQESLY